MVHWNIVPTIFHNDQVSQGLCKIVGMTFQCIVVLQLRGDWPKHAWNQDLRVQLMQSIFKFDILITVKVNGVNPLVAEPNATPRFPTNISHHTLGHPDFLPPSRFVMAYLATKIFCRHFHYHPDMLPLKQARGWFAGEGRVSVIGDARRFQGYE